MAKTGTIGSDDDMETQAVELRSHLIGAIRRQVAEAGTLTAYRDPLIGFASANDPRFRDLRAAVPSHRLPEELLPGARTVVAFFLPFARWVVDANASHPENVASEWATAYVETNTLIGRITTHLIEVLAARGIGAIAEPPTHNFDPGTLTSGWSHKSVAVIAGLGSFGLHRMVITDAGCAGRFGSLIIGAELPIPTTENKERCLFYHDGSCRGCIERCPVNALAADGSIDGKCCYQHLLTVAKTFEHLGVVDVCGKCALGPCALRSAV